MPDLTPEQIAADERLHEAQKHFFAWEVMDLGEYLNRAKHALLDYIALVRAQEQRIRTLEAENARLRANTGTIWVVGEIDQSGRFRGFSKCLGDFLHTSAKLAFSDLEITDDRYRSSFRVFEVAISGVVELANASEEGKSMRVQP